MLWPRLRSSEGLTRQGSFQAGDLPEDVTIGPDGDVDVFHENVGWYIEIFWREIQDADDAGIDKAFLRRWLRWMEETGPEGLQPIIRAFRVYFQLVNTVEELSFCQVTNRLARLLARLPDEQLMGQTDIRLTRDELAARLGTVREVGVACSPSIPGLRPRTTRPRLVNTASDMCRWAAAQASRGRVPTGRFPPTPPSRCPPSRRRLPPDRPRGGGRHGGPKARSVSVRFRDSR